MRYFTLDKNLYTGSSVRTKNRGLLHLLLSRKRSGRNYYCIIYPGTAKGAQAEIRHSVFLKNPYYRKHPVHVIGVASTLDEAYGIIVKISDEAVTAGMTGDLRGYLAGRCCS